MKGMRLGLLDKTYVPLVKKGYKGFVENFMVSDGNRGGFGGNRGGFGGQRRGQQN